MRAPRLWLTKRVLYKFKSPGFFCIGGSKNRRGGGKILVGKSLRVELSGTRFKGIQHP